MTKDMDKLSVAREAFLNLIADAIKWEEQPDEAAIYYTLETTHESLVPLMNALGIEQKYRSIIVDGEHYAGEETPAEALERVINDDIAALLQPAPDAFCEKERDQLREVVATYIDRAKIATIREDLQQAVDGAIEWANAKDIRPRGEATMEALAALTPAPQPAEVKKLPRLTRAMIEAACKAHYGDDNIDGIDLAANDRNYTFEQGFRRMWQGIAAAIRGGAQ